MGLVLWLVCGAAAFLPARIIPLLRRGAWIGEFMVSVAAALLLGGAASALDFGGWREADWRAGLFTFFGAFAAVGAFRLITGRDPARPTNTPIA